MNRFKCILLFRKKLPQNSSIEELFKGLFQYFDKVEDIETEIEEVKFNGAKFKVIFKNIQQVRGLSADIFHITGDVHYLALAKKKNMVLTVHDCGSALRGSIFKKFIVKVFWFWLPALMVDRITVISEFSKLELSQLIPFAKKKIKVIHNPVNEAITESRKVFNQNYPLILHIGTKPNKNLKRTIKALIDIKCRLRIIGKLSQEQLNLLEDSNIDYENEFFVPYERILESYKECDIVTFVSTYEGFGMPIIEAQKIGRPVITSNCSSMPEVAGEGAMLVDPYDVESIRSAVLTLIYDPLLRNSLIEEGFENVKRFEIENISQQYIKLYSDILNEGS
ncbi:glycosyltransferase family 4 protein [Aegicerativicinus sediminis]|uniref:glycosyltransferase family 4 protein n=1 Tax=Aegicerativicinus sediminis TaxID=2893202 RepID=UPI001E609C9A|nr:glycosyltransferase family 1 protein [Aegicerativicinus sediminis]